MLFEKTYQDILSDTTNDLAQNTRINRLTPGGKARTILENTARKLNESYKTFDLNLARGFVDAAAGRYLDLIGELLNVTRIGSTAASATLDIQAVRFYVASGTFGSINSGSNIVIPAGTIISSGPAASGILYSVTISTTLLAASSSTFIPVQAVQPGSSSNLGAGQLTFHNFLNYTDSAHSTLLVVNDVGILNGTDVESDANYRFRITNAALSEEAANLTAIRLASLIVPGVSDVVFVPYNRGIGTFDVLVKAITPTVSDDLLAAVQNNIDKAQAHGINGLADRPRETGLSFNITIVLAKPLSVQDQNLLKTSVSNALINYVDGLDIGESFVINQAVDRVLNVSSNIKDIGQPGQPFDLINIYKETALQDNKIRSTLIKNYVPNSNERVIIEPSVSNPVTTTFTT